MLDYNYKKASTRSSKAESHNTRGAVKRSLGLIKRRTPPLCALIAAAAVSTSVAAQGIELIGEGPRLKPEDRVTQDQIVNGELTLEQIRSAGLLVFTTPFNKADGFGDGAHDPDEPDNNSPQAGNRPTLQGNGTFLRVNGLDAQTCLECHTIVSNAVVPARLGIGGVGGISASPMFRPDLIDVADFNRDGTADFTGRLINPPFLFGSGGVELVGKEMTEQLQALKRFALDNPGKVVALKTKGVHFGSIVADAFGNIDTTHVEGVADDLVVRPFGRKGDNATVREFDVGAMAFHFGMQSVEAFGGPQADLDKDGVRNEITVGDLSVLSIFNTTMDRPRRDPLSANALEGRRLFREIGCVECHRPRMLTDTRFLPYKLTGAPERPFADTFYSVDLTQLPMKFKLNDRGGIVVPMFSDLKRHDMGEGLKESFSAVSDKENREFITARLWGIADTAPYLHDGRAQTLSEAIYMHDSPGSEASLASQNFAGLGVEQKNQVLEFLMSLRTPKNPNADVAVK